MIFLTFLIIPILVCFFAWFFTDKITWKEVAVQLGIQIIFIGIMSFLMLNANMSDREAWNGYVTKKWSEKVSCRHSYKCFCYTTCRNVCSGSGKTKSCHQSCTEHCKTCYEHKYDVDWYAKNNIGESWDIDTVDRQGIKEPPRWTAINIGEPTSSLHSYENYIKGSPDSLFHKTNFTEEEVNTLPAYPDRIYDYWKLNRFVQLGTNFSDVKEWNEGISKLSGELGSKKQVNIIIVLVKDKPQEFFYTLERFWLGGKKNDVILIIGTNSSRSILWANVMSLSNEEFKVYLRNDILGLNYIDREKVLSTIKENVESKYIRRPMKDFEYLKESIKPTKGQWIAGMIFGLLLSFGLSIFFYYQDPFGDETNSRMRKKTLWR